MYSRVLNPTEHRVKENGYGMTASLHLFPQSTSPENLKLWSAGYGFETAIVANEKKVVRTLAKPIEAWTRPLDCISHQRSWETLWNLLTCAYGPDDSS